MKKIADLSRNELLSFVYQNIDNICKNDAISCAICGNFDAEWFYICDDCNVIIEDDND